MIDFELTEEQKMLQRTAHDFAEKEMRPIAKQIDADPDPNAALRTKEVIEKGLRMGFGKLLIPEKYGGSGRSLLDWCIMQEELSWGDCGMMVNLGLNSNFIPLVINMGATEEQKERWLRYFAADDTGDAIIVGCQTEPVGGSEALCPLPNPELGVKTTAVRQGDHYVINGAKCFVSGAALSKIAMIVARTDKTKPNFEGLTFFLTPTDNPGFKVGKTENKMGMRASHNTEVIFENMRVPAEDMLGVENGGGQIAERAEFAEGIGVGPIVVGLARAIYEEVVDYAKQRVIWGKPLVEYEHIANKLVNMATKILTARTLTWQLAWAGQYPEKAQGDLLKLSQMAKIVPSSMIWEIAEDASEIMGAYSYMKPSLLEKLVRDALIWPTCGIANAVKMFFTAQKLLRTN